MVDVRETVRENVGKCNFTLWIPLVI